jgi:bacillithiol synthase
MPNIGSASINGSRIPAPPLQTQPLITKMATVQDIPFRTIPRQSTLFLSYLDFAPAALRFYHHPPTIESVADSARNLLAGRPFPRKEIASILRHQNEKYGGDAETLRRISELEKPDSVAILTGQQVGLFTGPVYTIYKALTAIDISQDLRRRGMRAVPIFWMDTEDHDLPEITSRTVWEAPCSVRTIDYRKALFNTSEMPARSVGSLQFPETIQKVVLDYLSRLPDSIRKQEVGALLKSTYVPGATFALSFARFMMQLLRGSGLIFFDPQDADAKQLTSAVFQKALIDADAIHSALVQRNQELSDAGFHPQVNVVEDSTVLFFYANGERRALERRHPGFVLKNADCTFSLDELLDCARRTPELFSPSVLLRPLIQDHLFPTVAYAGGSSELAYFAQIEVLYTLFNRPMPVVWPRNSFTILDPEIAAEMDRLGIEVKDCFQGMQHVGEKAIHNSRFSETAAHIAELHDRLDQALTEIRPEVEAIEAPLGQALETARRKILHNIQRLKAQIIRLGGKQNCSALDLVLSHCYPNGNLQERELGIPHFLVRHGNSFLDAIAHETEIGNFAHRVIRLEDEA